MKKIDGKTLIGQFIINLIITVIVYTIFTFVICWALNVTFTFKLAIGVSAVAMLLKNILGVNKNE